jgi:small-conductance mechanosensitive channel
MALAVHAILSRLVRRSLTGRPFLLSLAARSQPLTRLAVVVIALELMLPAVEVPPEVAGGIDAGLRVVVVILAGWIALIAVDIGVTVYLKRYRLDTEDNLIARKHVTQMRVLKRVISTVVVLLTAGAALMTFGVVREIGVSLFASAGVAGIVAGLAARPVLSNLFAGIQLALTQPIRIEDVVILENEWGAIEEITSTYVVVRLWDLRRLIVPLSYFIETPFQNWTREGSALIGSVLLHLDYAAPVERIRARAREIAEGSKLWDRKVFNVQVTDATERTIAVRVLVSAKVAAAAWDLRCEMREGLIAFLRAEFPESLPRLRAEFTSHESRPIEAEKHGERGATRTGPPVVPAPR